jgi:hypothetical protein
MVGSLFREVNFWNQYVVPDSLLDGDLWEYMPAPLARYTRSVNLVPGKGYWAFSYLPARLYASTMVTKTTFYRKMFQMAC